MTFDQIIPDFGEWLFSGFVISLIRVALLIAGGFPDRVPCFLRTSRPHRRLLLGRKGFRQQRGRPY